MVDNSDLTLPTDDLSSHIEVPEKWAFRLTSGMESGMPLNPQSIIMGAV
jgi:hypothetical protein